MQVDRFEWLLRLARDVGVRELWIRRRTPETMGDARNQRRCSSGAVGVFRPQTAPVTVAPREGSLQLVVSSLSTRSKWILIAGPYRSGTGDNPELLEKNVKCMESYALPVFRAGHMPLLGEWLALPLVHAAGSQRVGDPVFNEIFHPIAICLLDKCDAVLRVGGPSAGADEMVRIARERGLDVYSALEEIPGYTDRVSN